MFENISKFPYKTLINFGSGAEFDRRFNISNATENEYANKTPVDFYGLSKNIITSLLCQHKHAVNLRLFGCFYHNELETRFIRSAITSCVRGQPITIFKNRYMDFFYMKDLAIVVKFFLENPVDAYTDVNMSYMTKLTLHNIAEIVSDITRTKSDIIISDPEIGLDYTGNGEYLHNLDLKLSQLERGIYECVNNLI
jgi:GDP-L-fucose synthase